MSQLVTPANLDTEFSLGGVTPNQISLQLGAGLQKSGTGVINVILGTTTAIVDQSFILAGTLSGDSNQPNTILGIATNRVDAPWTITNNVATYSGTPDHVVIDFNEWFDPANSNELARISPVLEILRNGAVVASINTSYQRHATGHNSSSNGGCWTDPNPGTNSAYSLRAQQGSNQDDVLNIDLGHVTFRAVEKVTVLTSVTAI